MDRLDVPAELHRLMVEVARQFRKGPTRGEAVLWQCLRGRQVDGLKFRRQKPLGPFVVDFFCAEQRLIVEVDGPVHDDQVEADAQRQRLLEAVGFRFCRIRTDLVERDVAAALALVRDALQAPSFACRGGDGI